MFVLHYVTQFLWQVRVENTVDVESNSPNLNMSIIKQNSSDISIIPHMYGIPIQIDADNTLVIEDCCQALGAKVKQIKWLDYKAMLEFFHSMQPS